MYVRIVGDDYVHRNWYFVSKWIQKYLLRWALATVKLRIMIFSGFNTFLYFSGQTQLTLMLLLNFIYRPLSQCPFDKK